MLLASQLSEFSTILFLGLVSLDVSASPSCTAPAAVEGEATSITCQFAEDLSSHKHSFNILRYDYEGLKYVPELVLRCIWRSQERSPSCTTSKGFEFKGNVTDRVTVFIRHLTWNHAGSYVCDYLSVSRSDARPCNLHVKHKKISCTTHDVTEGETISVTCHFNSDLNKTKDDFYISRAAVGKHESVLTCNFIGERTHCFTKPDVNFNEQSISRQATITIPLANESHAGRYYCDIVPPDKGVKVEHCNLHVNAAGVPALTVSVPPTYTTIPRSTPQSSATAQTTGKASCGVLLEKQLFLLPVAALMRTVIGY